jgi:hypothetical protein
MLQKGSLGPYRRRTFGVVKGQNQILNLVVSSRLDSQSPLTNGRDKIRFIEDLRSL